MSDMIRDDMIERLKRLDEDAALTFDDERRFHMIIVGGGALILLNTITRSTQDIDALYAPRELLALMEKYDINNYVQAYMHFFPFNYEDRLQKIPIESEKIDFYTASLEDIVIAKLNSARPTDRQDILDERVVSALDWKLLERLALDPNETKASAMNDRSYQDFLVDYYEYVRRCRPCGN